MTQKRLADTLHVDQSKGALVGVAEAAGISRMVELEQRPRVDVAADADGDGRAAARKRVVWLFVLVFLGFLAKWGFETLGVWLEDTSKDLKLPGLKEIGARGIVGLIVAGLIFPQVYTRIGKPTKDTWMIYFVAFQNGFFWQALFDSLAGGFADTEPAT